MALKVWILFARLVMIPQIIGVTHSKSCVVEEKKLRNDINLCDYNPHKN